MAEQTRRHPRYEIETQVIYRVEAPPGASPQDTREGRTRNLSEGGLLLEAEEHLPPGTRLTLLLIRGKRGGVEGEGQVVWAEDPAPKPWLRHGIWITRMEPRQQLAWELFLYEAGREVGSRPIRFDIDLAVTCRRQDGHDVREGRALNVSRKGMLVLLPAPFPVGTVFSLEMQRLGRSLGAEARVVRQEGPRADGLIPHGMAYVDPQEGSRLLPELLVVGLL